jgi:signal transduction histidine kinase
MQNSFRFIHQRYKYTDYLKLEITDNGMGFDQAFKDQMFELFKKLHHGSGMGLGLALSKKIVENHHGIIEAEGVAGAGASITIYLPLHHAQQTS